MVISKVKAINDTSNPQKDGGQIGSSRDQKTV